jgi:hypothetical protein
LTRTFFLSLYSHREYVSNSEEPNETQESEINMNRRINAPSPQPIIQHQQYGPPNPIQSNNYARQQIAPPKKTIQHDADVYVDLSGILYSKYF